MDSIGMIEPCFVCAERQATSSRKPPNDSGPAFNRCITLRTGRIQHRFLARDADAGCLTAFVQGSACSVDEPADCIAYAFRDCLQRVR